MERRRIFPGKSTEQFTSPLVCERTSISARHEGECQRWGLLTLLTKTKAAKYNEALEQSLHRSAIECSLPSKQEPSKKPFLLYSPHHVRSFYEVLFDKLEAADRLNLIRRLEG